MKFKLSQLVLALGVMLALAGPVHAQTAMGSSGYYTNNVPNYMDQQGVFHVGGSFKVDPTGQLDANPPFSSAILGNSDLKVVQGRATLAQINAGATILTGLTGRTLYIHSIAVRAIGGSFAGCTTVAFADTAGSPVQVLSYAATALTVNTTVPGSGGTMGAGYTPEPLTAGAGLAISKTGSACTTATALDFEITYGVQ